MTRFSVGLKSLSPLLQNRMSEEALLNLRDKTKKKSKVAAKPSLEDEAASKIHVDAEGRPCIPRKVLMAALIEGGRFIRLDQKRQLSTKDSSLLPGLLVLEAESWPLLDPQSDSGDISKWGLASWRYDLQQGRNPNGGEAVCCVRPMFEHWAFFLHCLLDLDELPEDTYLRLFGLTGNRIGLCDFRPACKGTFGQFCVVQWKRITDDVPLVQPMRDLVMGR